MAMSPAADSRANARDVRIQDMTARQVADGAESHVRATFENESIVRTPEIDNDTTDKEK